MKRCSSSLVMREIQIKKQQQGTTSHLQTGKMRKLHFAMFWVGKGGFRSFHPGVQTSARAVSTRAAPAAEHLRPLSAASLPARPWGAVKTDQQGTGSALRSVFRRQLTPSSRPLIPLTVAYCCRNSNFSRKANSVGSCVKCLDLYFDFMF